MLEHSVKERNGPHLVKQARWGPDNWERQTNEILLPVACEAAPVPSRKVHANLILLISYSKAGHVKSMQNALTY